MTARTTPRPVLPSGYGVTEVDLPQARMQEWLDNWMKDLVARIS